MNVAKDKISFHTTYDDKTMENMKRYYGIDTDDELVKYIKKNVEHEEAMLCIIQKANKRL